MQHQIQQAQQELVNALEIIHSPSTTNQLRIQTTQHLEQFKTATPPSISIQISLELIRNFNYSVHCRHFGFQLFEYIILNHYSNFTSDECQGIKQQLFDLVRPQPTAGLNPQQQVFQPSPLVNYQTHQNSILSTKLASLLVRVAIIEWPQQRWVTFFPDLIQFYSHHPSIDYSLLLIEIFTLFLDIASQPSPSLPDSQRKVIFPQLVKQFESFLEQFFAFCVSLIKLLSCDITELQLLAPYIIQTIPDIQQQIQLLRSNQINSITDNRLRWMIKHALELSLRLSQHVCERSNLNDVLTQQLFTILAQLLSLPDCSDEILEQISILLQRRTGIQLQYQANTLLQLWHTLVEVSSRILQRSSICNEMFTLLPQQQKNTSQVGSLSYFYSQQPLLLKTLRNLHFLINSFSGPIQGILVAKQRDITQSMTMIQQQPHQAANYQGALQQAEQIVNGIFSLRTSLLQLLCRCCLDLDCSDLVCSQALLCLLDCTGARLYATYITNPFLIEKKLVEPLVAELWNVILSNNDRPRQALLQGKTRGGVEKRNNSDQISDDLGSNNNTQSNMQDVLGQIRSGLQLLVKNVTSRQPHLILQCLGTTFQSSIQTLLTLAAEEQSIITNTKQFPSTIANNSKSIHYIYL
jgi:hypothetical protein